MPGSSPPISGRPLLSELIIKGLFVSFPRWVVIVFWAEWKLYGGGMLGGIAGWYWPRCLPHAGNSCRVAWGIPRPRPPPGYSLRPRPPFRSPPL